MILMVQSLRLSVAGGVSFTTKEHSGRSPQIRLPRRGGENAHGKAHDDADDEAHGGGGPHAKARASVGFQNAGAN